jgi:hypothetical protein
MSEDEKNQSTDKSGDSGSAGSSGSEDSGDVGISDDQLPEDLQPTDDNPLAKAPSDDEDGDGQGISLGPDGPEA